MAGLILIAVAGIAAWAGSLYLWPFRPCWKCGGSGRNKGSSRRRFGECRLCQASGRRRRLGAKTIHRGAVSLADKARARKGGK